MSKIIHGKRRVIFLIHGKRRTKALDYLETATKEGVIPPRHGWGWKETDILRDLAEMGFLEARYTGPRGGKRWHATPKGRQAVMDANLKLASMSAREFSKQFD